MGADRVRKLLSKACAAAGGQKQFAEQHSVSPQYICDVLWARREPGDAVLAALGLERVVTYRAKAVTP